MSYDLVAMDSSFLALVAVVHFLLLRSLWTINFVNCYAPGNAKPH